MNTSIRTSLALFGALVCAASATVYRPGLMQYRYDCATDTTADFNKDLSSIASDKVDRTYGCIMGNKSYGNGGSGTKSEVSESATGTQWWWDNNTAYAYDGEIWLAAGMTITVWGNFDDGSAAFIDDLSTPVFNQGTGSGYNGKAAVGSFTAPASGWYAFRGFVWDWTGGKNICQGALAALQWNTAGVTAQNSSSPWAKFTCDNSMTFLRTAADESFMTVGKLDVSGNDALVDVAFAGVPAEAKLRAYYGSLDGGTDPRPWTGYIELATISAGDTAETAYTIPDGKNYAAIRLCLIRDANDANAFYEFDDPIEFSQPAPAVVLSNAEPDHVQISGSVQIAKFGIGGTSASIGVEVSDTEDFTSILGSVAVTTATTAGSYNYTITGLAPNTDYYVRAVAENNLGVRGVSAPVEAKTLSAFVAPGIAAYSFTDDGLSVTVMLTELYLSSATIDLYVDNALAGTRTVSDAGSVPFLVSGRKTDAALRAVITAGTDSQEYIASAHVGSSMQIIDNVAGHDTGVTALRLRVGDSAVLPPVYSPARYETLNRRFISLDGTTITAKEPGIAAVEYYDAAGASTVIGVIVLPETTGKIYIYKSGNVWDNASAWEQVGADQNTSWPCNADDAAILVSSSGFTIRNNSAITLGFAYWGSFGRNSNFTDVWECNNNNKSVSLQRTDGKPAEIKVCGNGQDGGKVLQLQMAGYTTTFHCVSDVVIDKGWDNGGEDSDAFNRTFNKLKFKGATVDIPEGVTLTITGGSPRGYGSGANWTDINFENTNYLTGSGTYRHTGRGIHTFKFTCSGFTGTIVDAAGPHSGGYDRSGNTMLHSATVGNAAMAVEGFVVRNGTENWDSYKSVGMLKEGCNHGYGDADRTGNRLAGRELILRGGYVEFSPEKNAWGEGTVQSNYTARLTIDKGMTVIKVDGNSNVAGHPTNIFYAASIASTTNRGTLYLRETNRIKGTVDTYKSAVMFPSFNGSGSFGDGSDCTQTETYSIRPNIVAFTKEGSWGQMTFASVDSEGRLQRPVYTNRTGADFAGNSGLNGFLEGKALTFASGVTTVTLNSLAINNRYNGARTMGAGNTLVLTSGGLILNENQTGIGDRGKGDNNGNLVFGATAYVWAMANDANNPNRIWAKMTAPYGFVSAMAGGHLEIAGDQTGIDGSIDVNGGTLFLGAANGSEGVTIDVPIRILPNATVKVMRTGTLRDIEITFDDVAAQHGKLVLPDGETEACAKAYILDEMGERISVVRGTYGSSESSAEFIDDEHFSGTGVLRVRLDDLRQPTILIFR